MQTHTVCTTGSGSKEDRRGGLKVRCFLFLLLVFTVKVGNRTTQISHLYPDMVGKALILHVLTITNNDYLISVLNYLSINYLPGKSLTILILALVFFPLMSGTVH